MGDHIIGIKQVHEVSLTRKAANQHCVKVLQKSLASGTAHIIHGDPEPDPKSTEPEMDKAIIKALLSLNDDGKAYALSLDDDAQEVFLKKSAAEIKAEVDTHVAAEKAKSEAAAEAEKAKSAKDPTVAALEEKVKSLESERTIEKAAARTREIEKRAATEFPMVPDAVKILKSIDSMSADDQAVHVAGLKARQEIAKSFGTLRGDSDAIPGDATTKHDALVAEVAKTKNISKSQATVEVANDPENSKLIAEMRAEMAG